MPQRSTHPPRGIRAGVVALALLPAFGVLVATQDALAAAVALALGPLAAGGAWAMAHRTILARTEQLAATADRIAAGDLAARVGLRRAGLGRLGRAVDSLAQSAEALGRRSRLMEAAPAAILALDLEGRVTHANAAALAVLRVPGGALHGRLLHDVLHGHSCEHPADACPLVASARAVQRQSEGKLTWTAAPVHASGQVEAIAVVLEMRA